jgi:enoyl-CoA hydratase/3-hydroxyacyl-CoA dehydrogenase
MSSGINVVAVIGAGIMGHGIAQVSALSGCKVRMVDVSEGLLKSGLERIGWSLGKLAEKKVISETVDAVMNRITATTKLADAVKDIDCMIEAVPENIDLKMETFAEADKNAPPDAILATNTSGLSVTMIGEATKRPNKVVGMHWMNPPQMMPLIEVIKGKHTSDETLKTTVDLCQRFGKQPVVARKDIWFFLAARSEMGWDIEANLMWLRGEAKVEEIDAMARYKLKLPMGPFELSDLTGAADIMKGAYTSIDKILTKNPDFEPNPVRLYLFKRLAEQVSIPRSEGGKSGMKTGEGYYKYPGPGKYARPEIPKELAEKVAPVEVLASAANSASQCVTDGVGSLEDTDKCFKLAFGWPKGVFEFADEFGIHNIVNTLREKKARVPDWQKSFYQPDSLLLRMVEDGKIGKIVGQGFYKY